MAREFININKKKAQFFISINKRGAHTFIMLGVYDQHKVTHVLGRVGKVAIPDGYHDSAFCDGLLFILQALFTNTKARLEDEGIERRSRRLSAINYQAYDITYRQYIEFIHVLEALQTPENKFFCYIPDYECGDEVTLSYRNVDESLHQPQMDKIKKSAGGLNIGNTCRHTAIDIVEEVQRAPVSSSVSNIFFRNLPYETNLEYGKPSADIPFYVLPITPAAYPNLAESQKWVVEKLYRRMEQMLLLEPHAQQTQDKFAQLKALYKQIIGPQQQLSLRELLASIQQWKQDNQTSLAALRKTYPWDFFCTRQSATMKTVQQIEEYLQHEPELTY